MKRLTPTRRGGIKCPTERPRSNGALRRGQPWTILALTCTRGKARFTSSPRRVRSSSTADPHRARALRRRAREPAPRPDADRGLDRQRMGRPVSRGPRPREIASRLRHRPLEELGARPTCAQVVPSSSAFLITSEHSSARTRRHPLVPHQTVTRTYTTRGIGLKILSSSHSPNGRRRMASRA
jgi:hypothetical protein